MLLPIALLAWLAPTPALGREVVAEINFARTRPQEYAEELREYRALFVGKVVRYPGNPDGVLTQEGTRAVDDAIDFLERQSPLPPLTFASLLAEAAGDHAADQRQSGKTGHLSSDGANPRDRVQRRGGGVFVAEAITYGPSTAREVVRQFIVDDAVPTRGHRKTLFAAEMRFAGARCGPHKVYRTMCVVEFGRTPTGVY